MDTAGAEEGAEGCVSPHRGEGKLGAAADTPPPWFPAGKACSVPAVVLLLAVVLPLATAACLPRELLASLLTPPTSLSSASTSA